MDDVHPYLDGSGVDVADLAPQLRCQQHNQHLNFLHRPLPLGRVLYADYSSSRGAHQSASEEQQDSCPRDQPMPPTVQAWCCWQSTRPRFAQSSHLSPANHYQSHRCTASLVVENAA